LKNTQKHTNRGILQPVNQRESRYARLTWNTNDWISPSGPTGKSIDKNTYEQNHGFGHEEWLFDLEKIIEGYHYGFLEPVSKYYHKYKGKYFDVMLYTIDGRSKKKLQWIGKIERLYVLKEEEAAECFAKYCANEWLQEMKGQLSVLGLDYKHLSEYEKQPYLLFNVKFSPECLCIYDPYKSLPQNLSINRFFRYHFGYFTKELQEENNINDIFHFCEPENIEPPAPIIENRTYSRPAKRYEIKYLHNTISQKLVANLRDEFGVNNVTPEHGMADNRHIDIVVNSPEGLIFYEIKTYSTLRISIREAIGQLLEYAFWPESSHAKKLIIVSHMEKDIETENYLKHIRKKFRIPIYYQSYNCATRTLSAPC